MNREKKTLLNIQLLLQYYKNDNILDRYHRIIESGIVFDNEILEEIQPNIYIVKYNKYIKLKKEVDRLNNIINELEKWLNEDEYFNGRKLKKDYITVLVTDVLDKLKELKNGDNNE